MRKIFSEFKIAHLSKSVLKLTEPLGKWQKKKLVANPSLEKFWLFQRWSLLMMESEEEWDHAICFFPPPGKSLLPISMRGLQSMHN